MDDEIEDVDKKVWCNPNLITLVIKESEGLVMGFPEGACVA